MTEALPARRSEAGTTLIELIVTVAIMGFAMLAILGGIGTSIIFADKQRQDATIGVVLTTSAEKIVSKTDTGYVACTDTYPAPPSPTGYAVAVMEVRFWEPVSNRFVMKPELASCNAPVTPTTDFGLQRIRLSVTTLARSGRPPVVEVLEVVKRQPES